MAKKGLVFISKTSFSAVSSVSVDNCFSATYTHYLVKRNLLGSAADNEITVRLRVSAADASGANYRRQYVEANSTTVSGNRFTGETSFRYALGQTEATSFGYSELWISNPFEAVRTTAWSDVSRAATADVVLDSFLAAHDLTTSYTGFTVIPSSGTITGSVSVWGLVKS